MDMSMEQEIIEKEKKHNSNAFHYQEIRSEDRNKFCVGNNVGTSKNYYEKSKWQHSFANNVNLVQLESKTSVASNSGDVHVNVSPKNITTFLRSCRFFNHNKGNKIQSSEVNTSVVNSNIEIIGNAKKSKSNVFSGSKGGLFVTTDASSSKMHLNHQASILSTKQLPNDDYILKTVNKLIHSNELINDTENNEFINSNDLNYNYDNSYLGTQQSSKFCSDLHETHYPYPVLIPDVDKFGCTNQHLVFQHSRKIDDGSISQREKLNCKNNSIKSVFSKNDMPISSNYSTNISANNNTNTSTSIISDNFINISTNNTHFQFEGDSNNQNKPQLIRIKDVSKSKLPSHQEYKSKKQNEPQLARIEDIPSNKILFHKEGSLVNQIKPKLIRIEDIDPRKLSYQNEDDIIYSNNSKLINHEYYASRKFYLQETDLENTNKTRVISIEDIFQSELSFQNETSLKKQNYFEHAYNGSDSPKKLSSQKHNLKEKNELINDIFPSKPSFQQEEVSINQRKPELGKTDVILLNKLSSQKENSLEDQNETKTQFLTMENNYPNKLQFQKKNYSSNQPISKLIKIGDVSSKKLFQNENSLRIQNKPNLIKIGNLSPGESFPQKDDLKTQNNSRHISEEDASSGKLFFQEKENDVDSESQSNHKLITNEDVGSGKLLFQKVDSLRNQTRPKLIRISEMQEMILSFSNSDLATKKLNLQENNKYVDLTVTDNDDANYALGIPVIFIGEKQVIMRVAQKIDICYFIFIFNEGILFSTEYLDIFEQLRPNEQFSSGVLMDQVFSIKFRKNDFIQTYEYSISYSHQQIMEKMKHSKPFFLLPNTLPHLLLKKRNLIKFVMSKCYDSDFSKSLSSPVLLDIQALISSNPSKHLICTHEKNEHLKVISVLSIWLQVQQDLKSFHTRYVVYLLENGLLLRKKNKLLDNSKAVKFLYLFINASAHKTTFLYAKFENNLTMCMCPENISQFLKYSREKKSMFLNPGELSLYISKTNSDTCNLIKVIRIKDNSNILPDPNIFPVLSEDINTLQQNNCFCEKSYSKKKVVSRKENKLQASNYLNFKNKRKSFDESDIVNKSLKNLLNEPAGDISFLSDSIIPNQGGNTSINEYEINESTLNKNTFDESKNKSREKTLKIGNEINSDSNDNSRDFILPNENVKFCDFQKVVIWPNLDKNVCNIETKKCLIRNEHNCEDKKHSDKNIVEKYVLKEKNTNINEDNCSDNIDLSKECDNEKVPIEKTILDEESLKLTSNEKMAFDNLYVREKIINTSILDMNHEEKIGLVARVGDESMHNSEEQITANGKIKEASVVQSGLVEVKRIQYPSLNNYQIYSCTHCSVCGAKFSSAIELLFHFYLDKKCRLFIMEGSHDSFNDRLEKLTSCTSDTSAKFRCEECKKDFSSSLVYCLHFDKHNFEHSQTFFCYICFYFFLTPYAFYRHNCMVFFKRKYPKNMYMSKPSIQGTQNKIDSFNLYNNLDKDLSQKLLVCLICRESYNYLSGLICHLKLSIVCINKIFENYPLLFTNSKFSLIELIRKVDKNFQLKEIICEICNSMCSSEIDYCLHQDHHILNNSSLFCKCCENVFDSPCSFYRHECNDSSATVLWCLECETLKDSFCNTTISDRNNDLTQDLNINESDETNLLVQSFNLFIPSGDHNSALQCNKVKEGNNISKKKQRIKHKIQKKAKRRKCMSTDISKKCIDKIVSKKTNSQYQSDISKLENVINSMEIENKESIFDFGGKKSSVISKLTETNLSGEEIGGITESHLIQNESIDDQKLADSPSLVKNTFERLELHDNSNESIMDLNLTETIDDIVVETNSINATIASNVKSNASISGLEDSVLTRDPLENEGSNNKELDITSSSIDVDLLKHDIKNANYATMVSKFEYVFDDFMVEKIGGKKIEKNESKDEKSMFYCSISENEANDKLSLQLSLEQEFSPSKLTSQNISMKKIDKSNSQVLNILSNSEDINVNNVNINSKIGATIKKKSKNDLNNTNTKYDCIPINKNQINKITLKKKPNRITLEKKSSNSKIVDKEKSKKSKGCFEKKLRKVDENKQKRTCVGNRNLNRLQKHRTKLGSRGCLNKKSSLQQLLRQVFLPKFQPIVKVTHLD